MKRIFLLMVLFLIIIPIVFSDSVDLDVINDDDHFNSGSGNIVSIASSSLDDQVNIFPSRFMFNMSGIPSGQSINTATFYFYINSTDLSAGFSGYNCYEYANYTWDEDDNIRELSSIGSILDTFFPTSVDYKSCDVSSWVITNYQQGKSNVSFHIQSNNTGITGSGSISSKENPDMNVPYLHVDFDFDISPTTSNKTISPSIVYTTTDINLSMTCTDGVNNDELTAYWQTYLDVGSGFIKDGDVGGLVVVDSVETTVYTYNSGNFSKDDKVLFEVWCGDGYSNSSKTNTSNVTVLNSIPISLVNISNVVAEYDDDLFCDVSIFDFDNDSLTLNETLWYVDGLYNSSFDNSSVIGNGNTSYGENWTCSARVNDGSAWSLFVNDSQVIDDNTNPDITYFNVSLTDFDSSQTMTTTVNCSDEGSDVSFVKMLLNGSSLENKSFSQDGDVWTYEQTYGVGNYTIKEVYCSDIAGNINISLFNQSFYVTAPEQVSGGGGGGGGLTTVVEPVINTSFEVVPLRINTYALVLSQNSSWSQSFVTNRNLSSCLVVGVNSKTLPDAVCSLRGSQFDLVFTTGGAVKGFGEVFEGQIELVSASDDARIVEVRVTAFSLSLFDADGELLVWKLFVFIILGLLLFWLFDGGSRGFRRRLFRVRKVTFK